MPSITRVVTRSLRQVITDNASRWARRSCGAALCAASAGLVLAACGGSTHRHKTPKPVVTTPQSTTTVSATPAPTALTVSVTTTNTKTASSSATVTQSQYAAIRAVLPPSAAGTTSLVRWTVDTGPARSLTIVARTGSQSSHVTLHSGTKKPITLQLLHFPCALRPAPSFCPLRQQRTSKTAVTFSFRTKPSVPVVLTGTIGPTTPRPMLRSSPAVVAPYASVEHVLAVVPKQKPVAGLPPATAASVKAGDTVVLRTQLSGPIKGAPQALTIKLPQGPAKRLVVSARVPGGVAGHATVTSATGSPITLIDPRLTCYVAPAPTACPARSVSVSHAAYSLQFAASPATPSVTLVATVAAG